MVSVGDDEGQALVVAIFVVALAAVSIVGLEAAQSRIFAAARSQRAGEAATEAALASVADDYVAYVTSLETARTSTRPRPDIAGLLADPRVTGRANDAANALAGMNGGERVGSLALTCSGGRIEASLSVDGRPHRAAFNAPECSPR